MIEQALELGITGFDHADIHASEAPFGAVLALAPHLRQRMEIVGKYGIHGGLFGARLPHYNTGSAHIIASAEQSLRHLNTEHLDLLLHRPDPLMDADEVAEAFAALRAGGKVRHFGASNFNPAQFELLNDRVAMVTNQVEFSPPCLDRWATARWISRSSHLFEHPAIAAMLEELAARYGVASADRFKPGRSIARLRAPPPASRCRNQASLLQARHSISVMNCKRTRDFSGAARGAGGRRECCVRKCKDGFWRSGK
ncbi:aldo/keto reductase [Janthinobacterium sp. LB3P112]|uniref:aldo/keto reductase n=1 Tax=Janthinobacterium sp. LB3P112 TaxID=3424196 RepID=UPI003F21A619